MKPRRSAPWVWPTIDIGARLPLMIRREVVRSERIVDPVRVLYISDIHLGAPGTRRVLAQLTEAVRMTPHDLLLLGGDVLDSRLGLRYLDDLISAIIGSVPVAAIPGNHDMRAGLIPLRTALVSGGVHWLPDGALPVRCGSSTVSVVSDVVDLTTESDPFSILCAHEPEHFYGAVKSKVPLTLAGHLHGGQGVLFERHGGLYPGALFNRLTTLRTHQHDSVLIVSRGLNEFIPIRFNCPREVILCTLIGSASSL
jgi:uncharacterized protein